MGSPIQSRWRSLALVTLSGALLTAGCGPGQTPVPTGAGMPGGSPVATPGDSASAACPAVPVPAENPEGWGAPSSSPTAIPILITTPIACGPNRVMFSFIDQGNEPIAAPDRSASIAIYELGRDAGTPLASAEGQFIWAIEDVRGVYVAQLDFPSSGRYGAEFVTGLAGGPEETIRMTFDVQPTSPVVGVGDPAPASRTPTLSDVGGDLAKISTDQDPEPAFYETSVDQALAAHEPFVLAFATPKFCQTAQCGPTLDRLKPFVDAYPTVTFINVEPYKLKLEGGSLEADLGPNGELQPVAVTAEWGLINEPIIFVVDRQGVVRAVFDLIFGDDELTAALDHVQ